MKDSVNQSRNLRVTILLPLLNNEDALVTEGHIQWFETALRPLVGTFRKHLLSSRTWDHGDAVFEPVAGYAVTIDKKQWERLKAFLQQVSDVVTVHAIMVDVESVQIVIANGGKLSQWGLFLASWLCMTILDCVVTELHVGSRAAYAEPNELLVGIGVAHYAWGSHVSVDAKEFINTKEKELPSSYRIKPALLQQVTVAGSLWGMDLGLTYAGTLIARGTENKTDQVAQYIAGLLDIRRLLGLSKPVWFSAETARFEGSYSTRGQVTPFTTTFERYRLDAEVDPGWFFGARYTHYRVPQPVYVAEVALLRDAFVSNTTFRHVSFEAGYDHLRSLIRSERRYNGLYASVASGCGLTWLELERKPPGVRTFPLGLHVFLDAEIGYLLYRRFSSINGWGGFVKAGVTGSGLFLVPLRDESSQEFRQRVTVFSSRLDGLGGAMLSIGLVF